MSSNTKPVQGDPEGVDGRVPNGCADDMSANGDAVNPDLSNGSDRQVSMEECTETEQESVAQGSTIPSVAPAKGCGTPPPPHVRKSLDTALKVVASQVSSPPGLVNYKMTASPCDQL